MLTQPEFPDNPFSLITSNKNQLFAKLLLNNGADVGKVYSLLIDYFSFKVVLNEIHKAANNPEWLTFKKGVKDFNKNYKKAIKCLEELLHNDSIPATTRNTIIEKDISILKSHVDFIEQNIHLKISIKPEPKSCHQMIGFQSFALYKYLGNFKGEKNDKDLYDFIAELLQNLYRDTVLNYMLKKINGDILKKNFIDNAYYKTSGKKYNELEKSVKPFDSKSRR